VYKGYGSCMSVVARLLGKHTFSLLSHLLSHLLHSSNSSYLLPHPDTNLQSCWPNLSSQSLRSPQAQTLTSASSHPPGAAAPSRNQPANGYIPVPTSMRRLTWQTVRLHLFVTQHPMSRPNQATKLHQLIVHRHSLAPQWRFDHNKRQPPIRPHSR
jgi:hypothetical protein